MATNPPRLYIALYLDADIHGSLVKQLRAKGYDVIYAVDVGNGDLDDTDQLKYAIREQRTILTHNTKDFEPLHQEYVRTKQDHYGIVTSNRIEIGELLRRVLNMLDQVDADQMKNQYHHLGEFK